MHLHDRASHTPSTPVARASAGRVRLEAWPAVPYRGWKTAHRAEARVAGWRGPAPTRRVAARRRRAGADSVSRVGRCEPARVHPVCVSPARAAAGAWTPERTPD